MYLGESETLNSRDKVKRTLRCRLFGHKVQKGQIARVFNDAALRDSELLKAVYQGWGCRRFGCGVDHSTRDPKAGALLPKLLSKIRKTRRCR